MKMKLILEQKAVEFLIICVIKGVKYLSSFTIRRTEFVIEVRLAISFLRVLVRRSID